MIANAAISTKQKSAVDLIWQNENVGASFSPQTVALPTGYSAFAIEFSGQTPDDRQRIYVPFSSASRFAYINSSRSTPSTTRIGRYIESAIDGSIEFGTGQYASYASSSWNTYNAFVVPTAIYGLKFTI